MIFYNFDNINKYNSLKKRIIPKKAPLPLKRFGEGDGSYVLENHGLPNLQMKILSYGVGSSMPFEENIASNYKSIIHCYDGSVDYTPTHNNIIFKKENLSDFNQFKIHCNKLMDENYSLRVLKMDIEGFEWEFFKNADMKYIGENFDYLCLELHGLIEEVPDNWIINPKTQKAKNNMNLKVEVLDKLNSRYDIIHIHGNNHSPRYFDMPDSLEITYKFRTFFEDEINIPFPIKEIDKPNFPERADYILDWWVDYHG